MVPTGELALATQSTPLRVTAHGREGSSSDRLAGALSGTRSIRDSPKIRRERSDLGSLDSRHYVHSLARVLGES